MQDQQSMSNGSTDGERLIGGDSRLRPYPNQVLKCPRCDSLNTKFCYYNNYNLSQPRHFCKNCRRYWTKGGVLRNVPVGGGCRKNKRSKLKSETPSSEDRRKQRKLNDNIHSSSESSTVTVSISEPACSSSLPALFSCSNSQLFLNQNPSNNLADSESPFAVDQSLDGCGGFDSIESFVGLLNAGNTRNATQISPFRLNHQQNELQQHEKLGTAEEMKMEELPARCDNDQTVGIDLSGSKNNGDDGELTALNWEGSQGLFDLTQEYWSQNQWTGPNQHIYLP